MVELRWGWESGIVYGVGGLKSGIVGEEGVVNDVDLTAGQLLP